MAHIEVSRAMSATPATIWKTLSDLGSHPRWMRDARSILFTTDRRRGVGTLMEVETRVGPFRTRDSLEVIRWEEGRSISVAHRGLVGGQGTLRVEDSPEGSRVVWEERLHFRWWLGGHLTAWLARPFLAAAWRGNLARLEELVSPP